MVGGGGELVVRYGASMVGRVIAIAWLLLVGKYRVRPCTVASLTFVVSGEFLSSNTVQTT